MADVVGVGGAGEAYARPTKTATDAYVEIAGAAKTYRRGGRETHALERIDLAIREGEFLAIVGPSGCGKSTLLRMVAGLHLPTTGEVHVDGARVDRPQTNLGIVFQSPVLLDWRTALANVLMQVELRGMDPREYRDRALRLLDQVGLKEFADRYPHELSGGMRQRVGIARALAVRPAILLMDEPLSALDSQTRELLMEDFIGLLADGTMGAVYVTHNLEEAVRLADRIVVLSRRPGRVREIVEIPMTRAERGAIDARGKLLALQNDLWSLIREEAIDAEREVQHA